MAIIAAACVQIRTDDGDEGEASEAGGKEGEAEPQEAIMDARAYAQRLCSSERDSP